MKQKILVTGATGFLGSHLVKRLLKDDHQVIIFKRSFSNTWRLKDVWSEITAYDLDRSPLDEPFRDVGKIDAVIHTATLYGRQQESFTEVFEANTAFPLRVLQVAADFQTDTFFNTDTYFNKGKVLYQHLNSYCLSKQHFREWGQQVAEQKKIRFVNMRVEHLFGCNDDDSKFTTFIIRQCLNNVSQIELTAGEQKRDFIHVDDAVSAYALLLSRVSEVDGYYQEYELGSGQTTSLREYVEMVKHLSGVSTELNFGTLPYREGEIMHSVADIKNLTELGWQPGANLEERLGQTIKAERVKLREENTGS